MLVKDVFFRRAKPLTSVAEQIDTNTPMGCAMLTILSAIAQLEREQIAESVHGVFQTKIRRGERAARQGHAFIQKRDSGYGLYGRFATVKELVPCSRFRRP